MAKAKNRTPDAKTIISAIFAQRDLSVVFFVMAILAIIIVPMPSTVLDLLLAVVIALSVLILLISLYIPRPTDLTTFPTLLLLITLFRREREQRYRG